MGANAQWLAGIADHFGMDWIAPVIIALTANVVQGEEEKYKIAGMSGYLYKPLRLQELTDLICYWGELKKDLFAKPLND